MRIHSLQGLRAICIMFVVLAHLSGTHNCFHSLVIERYGNLGVRIFLVLSGYLITSQLVKERTTIGTISLKTYQCRLQSQQFPPTSRIGSSRGIRFRRCRRHRIELQFS